MAEVLWSLSSGLTFILFFHLSFYASGVSEDSAASKLECLLAGGRKWFQFQLGIRLLLIL